MWIVNNAALDFCNHFFNNFIPPLYRTIGRHFAGPDNFFEQNEANFSNKSNLKQSTWVI